MEIITAITNVFTEVGNWIVGAVNSMIPMFYDTGNSELTLLGILSVVGLAISVVFLLIGIIQRFLHFAG